jgi:hypothetical protein
MPMHIARHQRQLGSGTACGGGRAAGGRASDAAEDLSDEGGDSAGPVISEARRGQSVPAWEVLAADSGEWRAGLKLKRLKVNGSEVGAC